MCHLNCQGVDGAAVAAVVLAVDVSIRYRARCAQL